MTDGKPARANMSVYRTPVRNSADARLNAPTFARNSPPIIARLAPWLDPLSGPVLEIGAGTGQHAAAMALAFGRLEWWPSDPDAPHRASIAAWQAFLRAPARAPFDLDGASDWAVRKDIQALGPLQAVVSMNVIHISPQSVAHGIIAGASKALAKGGLLIFYGPFAEKGAHTGAGNAEFDRRLQAENPAWGLRDLIDVTRWSEAAELERAAVIPMPANNRIVIFRRA